MSQGREGVAGSRGRRFELRSESSDGGEHIRVLGEMDLSVVGEVDREVARAEASDAAKIVLDLDELEFMDASGIRLLLEATARSRGNGGRLRIGRASSQQVQRVLELTGAGEVLLYAD